MKLLHLELGDLEEVFAHKGGLELVEDLPHLTHIDLNGEVILLDFQVVVLALTYLDQAAKQNRQIVC